MIMVSKFGQLRKYEKSIIMQYLRSDEIGNIFTQFCIFLVGLFPSKIIYKTHKAINYED